MADSPLLNAARQLAQSLEHLRFGSPVAHVYHPLVYAWEAHAAYLRRYAAGRKQILFLGMNPGPFGMVQTGVPFGAVPAVREWLGIYGRILAPPGAQPKRPVLGFECRRIEVSGQRLWGLFAARFATPDAFFKNHFVANYCPLAFLESTGKNRTPDKLRPVEKRRLFQCCDAHLRQVVAALRPDWVIGVGQFATDRAREALAGQPARIATILHPSPACPASNRDWAGQVTATLRQLGIWD